ncbi:MAG: transposase, partial [Synergistaceae bacterium]|nr:transposase [Synergistaceae bacterium]
MKRMVELACQYGRYGYRRITALLKSEGWKVTHRRVERLWRVGGRSTIRYGPIVPWAIGPPAPEATLPSLPSRNSKTE